jgi:energy-coupling factor transporter transmembrane protein EcfT
MKLKFFDERINSLLLLLVLLISWLYFFMINNLWLYIPVYIFIIITFKLNQLSFKRMLKITFLSFIFTALYSALVLAFPNQALMVGGLYSWQLGTHYVYKISRFLLESQFKIFVRIGTIASLSIGSMYAINYEKILIHLMQSKKIPAKLGYPILLAFNSIGLFKSELEKIRINARFRRIPLKDRFNLFFPLLVFAIRHAERGAMSLITRGLNENKEYFFDTQLKTTDKRVISIYFLILITCIIVKITLVA